jgi:hypothetical protein
VSDPASCPQQTMTDLVRLGTERVPLSQVLSKSSGHLIVADGCIQSITFGRNRFSGSVNHYRQRRFLCQFPTHLGRQVRGFSSMDVKMCTSKHMRSEMSPSSSTVVVQPVSSSPHHLSTLATKQATCCFTATSPRPYKAPAPTPQLVQGYSCHSKINHKQSTERD